MLTRVEKKQRTRNAILESAIKLSAKSGFSGLSLREITRVSEISPNAFYRHFKDMDDLALSLVDEIGVSLRHLLREARNNRFQKDGKGVVRASIEAFMAFLKENPNRFRLLLGERSGSSSSFRKAFHVELKRFTTELAEDLEDGFKRTGIPTSNAYPSAESITAVVFTLGAEALDLNSQGRAELEERLVGVVRQIIVGARHYRPQKD